MLKDWRNQKRERALGDEPAVGSFLIEGLICCVSGFATCSFTFDEQCIIVQRVPQHLVNESFCGRDEPVERRSHRCAFISKWEWIFTVCLSFLPVRHRIFEMKLSSTIENERWTIVLIEFSVPDITSFRQKSLSSLFHHSFTVVFRCLSAKRCDKIRDSKWSQPAEAYSQSDFDCYSSIAKIVSPVEKSPRAAHDRV